MTSKCERLVHGKVVSDHIVQLFDTEASLASSVAAYLADGFRRGDVLLMVARPAHWRATSKRLRKLGFDVEDAVEHRRLVVLDAATTLASFMRRGSVDAEQFEEVVGAAVRQLAATAPCLRIYGEMVDLLAEEGNLDGALHLETLWNDLARRYSFTLLCGYASAQFTNRETVEALKHICGAHSHLQRKSIDVLGNWILRNSRLERKDPPAIRARLRLASD